MASLIFQNNHFNFAEHTNFEEYRLLVEVGELHLYFGVASLKDNTVFAVQFWQLAEGLTWVEEANEVYQKTQLQEKTFAAVQVYVNTGKATVVPAALFTPQLAGSFLEVNFPLDINGVIQYDLLVPNQEMAVVYQINAEIFGWINQQFPQILLQHVFSKYILHALTIDEDEIVMKAYFTKRQLTVLVQQHHQLLQIQQYKYKTNEDVLYYLIANAKAFQLDKVILAGVVALGSHLVDNIKQNFKSIEFETLDTVIEITPNLGVEAYYLTPFLVLSK